MTIPRLVGVALCAAAGGFFGPPLYAQEKSAPADRPDLAAHLALVPPETLVFVHVRPSALAEAEPVRKLRKELGKDLVHGATAVFDGLKGMTPEEVEAVTMLVPAPGPSSRGHGPVTVVTTAARLNKDKLLTRVLGKYEERKYKDKVYYAAPQQVFYPPGVNPPARREPSPQSPSVYLADDHTFVAGQAAQIDAVLAGQGKLAADGPLGPALRAAAEGKHHVVAGWSLPPHFLPEPQPGRETGWEGLAVLTTLRPLFEAKPGLLTLDAGEEVRARAGFTFPDEKRAAEGAWAVKDGLAVLRLATGGLIAAVGRDGEGAAQARLLEEARSGLRAATVEQEGGVVRASVSIKVDPATVATALTTLKQIASRKPSETNLKQIALAFINYSNSNDGRLPTSVYSKDGKPLLSWRVLILPYIEEEALYNEFKLDEPWDGPNNKKLLARGPRAYTSRAGRAGPTETYYKGFNGPGGAFESDPQRFKARPALVPGVFEFGPGLHYPASFPDATPNTLMIAEAGDPVPWTKPDDISYDPKKPLPKLDGPYPDGFLAALCDGSARFIRKGVSEVTLRCLIERADGQIVDWAEVDGKPRGQMPLRVPPPASGNRIAPPPRK
jgi:hypothetical protein